MVNVRGERKIEIRLRNRRIQGVRALCDIPAHEAAGRAFFFSSRRRHTISLCDLSSDVCSSDLLWRVQIECDSDIARSIRYGGKHGQHHTVEKDLGNLPGDRSEERRVGKDGKCSWREEN